MDPGLTLKQFIKQSLSEICEAVESAREKRPYIARQDMREASSDGATNIDFDIGVTVTTQSLETSNLSGDAKAQASILTVLSTKVSTTGELESSNGKNISNENRIRFSVPVFFRYSEQEARTHENKIRDMQARNMSRHS